MNSTKIYELVLEIVNLMGYTGENGKDSNGSIQINDQYHLEKAIDPIIEDINADKLGLVLVGIDTVLNKFINVNVTRKVLTNTKEMESLVNMSVAINKFNEFYKEWKDTDFKKLVKNLSGDEVDSKDIKPEAFLYGYEDIMRSKHFNQYWHHKSDKPLDFENYKIYDTVIISDKVSDILDNINHDQKDNVIRIFFKVDTDQELFSQFLFHWTSNGSSVIVTDQMDMNPRTRSSTRNPQRMVEDKWNNTWLPYDALLDFWEEETKEKLYLGYRIIPHKLNKFKENTRFYMQATIHAIIERLKIKLPTETIFTKNAFSQKLIGDGKEIDDTIDKSFDGWEWQKKKLADIKDTLPKSTAMITQRKYSTALTNHKYSDQFIGIMSTHDNLSKYLILEQEAKEFAGHINTLSNREKQDTFKLREMLRENEHEIVWKKLGVGTRMVLKFTNPMPSYGFGMSKDGIFEQWSEDGESGFAKLYTDKKCKGYNSPSGFTTLYPNRRIDMDGIGFGGKRIENHYDGWMHGRVQSGGLQRCRNCNEHDDFYHFVIEVIHYQQLVWLLDLKDKSGLPPYWRNYEADKRFRAYIGNTTLNNVHPLCDITNPSNVDHQTGIQIAFTYCGRCKNKILKSVPETKVINVTVNNNF